MHDTDTWVTGWRRAVRSVAYGMSAVLIAVSAIGFGFGEASKNCKCEIVEPARRVLFHGGGIGLAVLAVVAGLTWAAWRWPARSWALTIATLMASLALCLVWAFGDTRAPDLLATQGQIATLLLLPQVLLRGGVDGAVKYLEARAQARGGALPVGTARRDA